MRSHITIDLGALRSNVETLRRAAPGAEVWAVVKANAYGHGALDCARAALGAGATALCVATVGEALVLRGELREPRVLVLGPTNGEDIAAARAAHLELVVSDGEIPDDVAVHLKLDTGMGRWGLSELPAPTRNVVGLMTHLATAAGDPGFARVQIARFQAATEQLPQLTRHVANSAAALRIPEARFDAVRCGIALYGLSPFGGDPRDDGLAPVLSWKTELAQVKHLAPGESTGYGRLFRSEHGTWIGILPLGYADGFRRDLAGTHVHIEGRACRVVGAVSMDATAVELAGKLPTGTPVTIIGPDLPLEEHARVAGTLNYELACRIDSTPARARRTLVADA